VISSPQVSSPKPYTHLSPLPTALHAPPISFSITIVSVYVLGFVCEYFVTKIRFHSEELLAPRPTFKLEEHPLSAVHDCLFNIFATTLHPQPEHASCRSDRGNLYNRQLVILPCETKKRI
jgi:hypothetical protein